MLLLIIQVVTMVALGVFLLSRSAPVTEVARWVCGVAAIIWAVILVLGIS